MIGGINKMSIIILRMGLERVFFSDSKISTSNANGYDDYITSWSGTFDFKNSSFDFSCSRSYKGVFYPEDQKGFFL